VKERGERTVHTEARLDPARPFLPSAEAWAGSRYRALYEIGRQLLGQKEPADVLQTIHRALVEHLSPDHACILAVEGDDSYRPLFTYQLDLQAAPDAWPLSWTVIRQVREGGQALLASDIGGDAALPDAESIHRFRIRSVMCVPLGSPVRGVAYLDNRSERAFTPQDLEFLAAVALYTSLLLERTSELVHATEAVRLRDERLEALESELRRYEIVGASPALLMAYDALRRFARSGARVLLRGETGTGKELFARAYAANSPRARSPYVPVTIPALAPTLVESELFGHVRGAFTEASRDKKGRLEVADGGVLFLDEVGDIDPAVQTKLLRFLDSGELYRVGDTQPRRIDTLVVSATNRPLEKDLESGRFRADLLARLGHTITIPPLRERPDDIPRLVEHFVRRFDRGPARKAFPPETLEVLRRHPWPFNVRELQQVVERTVCLVDRQVVQPEDLPEYVRREAAAAPARGAVPGEAPRPLREVVEEVEREHILRALEFTKGNRRRATELLQVSPETFYRRLEEFGLHKKS
jgi:transcriptional regulator with GAF, ATPase, and Fis domain